MSAHATLSPSGASGWMKCAPKLAMEHGITDTSSKFADEGTAAHFLASECLEQKVAADLHLNRFITVWSDAVSHTRGTNWHGVAKIPGSATIRHFGVDDDMAGHVQNYIDAIYTRMESFRLRGAVSVELLIEVRVEFSGFVGYADQFGTSDVVLLIEWPDGDMQIDVNDLKYGRGVKVDAADFELLANGSCELQNLDAGNPQMMIYALGAYDQFAALGNYTRASWCIHQPRLSHISEAECHMQTLLDWAADTLKPAAERAMMYFDSREVRFSPSDFGPGEKQCMFCKAGGSCQAAQSHMLNMITSDFVDLDQPVMPQIENTPAKIGHLTNDQIGDLLAATDFIEACCKAVRAKAEAELLAGRPVAGHKLVQGKQGNRAWGDEAGAEAVLKSFRLKQDQMYSFKLINPTTADKLLAKEQPKRWAKMLPFITRSEGKPSVAPKSDKRPALVLAPPEDAFSNLDSGEDFV